MHTFKVAATGREFTQQFEDLMIAQKVSLLQAASATKSISTKTGGKFEVRDVVMPPGPTGKVGTVAITDNMFVNAKTRNPDGAWGRGLPRRSLPQVGAVARTGPPLRANG
jgi:hypothetical protein